MTGESKTVEPRKDGLSGSLSGNKKQNSAQKKSEPVAESHPEDASKAVVKGRPPKISSFLVERSRKNGGRLTFGDLERIMHTLGMSNDAEEIEEIFSICEREGIEITNEDTDIDVVETAAENVDGVLSTETTSLEGDVNPEVPSDTPVDEDTETIKSAAEVDLNITMGRKIDHQKICCNLKLIIN